MLPVMADFSSASSLLTLGTPLAGFSGISGSDNSGGISFKSLLNEGDSEAPVPEITAEPAGSFLPETTDTAASRIAADLKPLNGNEVNKEDNANDLAASGEESLEEGDFYDLAADNDDLSQKLYSEELTSADYELYDPLSQAGEEISCRDLLRYATLPGSGNQEHPAIPSALKETISETALSPDLMSVLNPERAASEQESAISASHPALMSYDNDDSIQTSSVAYDTEAAPVPSSASVITAEAPGLLPELPKDMPFVVAASDGKDTGALVPAVYEVQILDAASETHSYRTIPDLVPEDEDLPVSAPMTWNDVSGSAVRDAGESGTVISEAKAAEHPAIKMDEKEDIAPDCAVLPRITAGNAVGYAERNAVDWGSSAPEIVYVPADDKILVSVKESAAPENAAGMTAVKPEPLASADGIYGKELVPGISAALKLAKASEVSAPVIKAAISDSDIDATPASVIPENAREFLEKPLENAAAISPEKRDPAGPVITAKLQESVIPLARKIPEGIPETHDSAAISLEDRHSSEAVMNGSQPQVESAAPAEPVFKTIREDFGESYVSAAASPENEAPTFANLENGLNSAPEAQSLKTAVAGNPRDTDSRADEIPASGSAAAPQDLQSSSQRAQTPEQLSGDKATPASESAPRPYVSERNQFAGREAVIRAELSGKLAAKMPDNTRASSEGAQNLRSLSKITGLESMVVREASSPVIRASGLGLEVSGVQENGAALAALNLLMAQKNVSTGVVSAAPVFFGEPEALTGLPDGSLQEDAGGEILPDSSAMISAGAETAGEDAGDSRSFDQEQRSSGSHDGLIPGRDQRGSGTSVVGTGSFGSIFGKGIFGTGGAQDADNSALTGAVRLFEGQSRENAERLRDQVLRMAARNLRKVEIALTPERLGHLKIEVEMGDSGKARVHFAVQSSEAREVLSQSMDRLRDSLAEAGISLEGHTVDQESGGESRGRERAEREWENSLRRLARSGRHAEWQDSLKGALDTLSGASGIRKFW